MIATSAWPASSHSRVAAQVAMLSDLETHLFKNDLKICRDASNTVAADVADDDVKRSYRATMNFEASVRGELTGAAKEPSTEVADELDNGPRE